MKKILLKKLSLFSVCSLVLLFSTLFISTFKVGAASDYSGGLLDGVQANLFSNDNNLGLHSYVTDNDETTFVTANPAGDPKGNNVAFINLQKINVDSIRIKTSLSNFVIKFKSSTGKITELSGSNIPKDGTIKDFVIKDITSIGIVNVGTSAGDVYEFNVYESSLKLNAKSGDSQAYLTWNEVEDADSYIISYGTKPGSYTEYITVTKENFENYVVPNLKNGTTYYFIVSSVINGVEYKHSNEAVATPEGPDVEPEQPSANRAILVVTMTTGLEKEYDLPMSDVNAFLNWYDVRDAGSGPAKFAINKYSNNKGPFSKRTDYVIFDKILTFEVSEYTTN